jgi:hypothetical protein
MGERLGQLLPQVNRNTQNTSHSCCLHRPKDNFTLYSVVLSRILYQYSIFQYKAAQTGRSLLIPTHHYLSWPGASLSLCLLYSSPVYDNQSLISFVLFQIYLTYKPSLITHTIILSIWDMKSEGLEVHEPAEAMKPCDWLIDWLIDRQTRQRATHTHEFCPLGPTQLPSYVLMLFSSRIT